MPPGLHLTIGTSPSPQPSIQQDLRLLKFGMLYGDSVRLCSPAVNLLLQWHTLKELARQVPEERQKPENVALLTIFAFAILYISSSARAKKDAAALQHAAWLGELTPEAAAAVTRVVEYLAQLEQTPDDVLTGGEISGELAQLVEAVDSGVAQLQEFHWDEPEVAVRKFVEQITTAVLSGDTYPLLDAGTGELLSKLIADPEARGSAAGAAKHVHLAARLFERLPIFENATIAELLDIRRDLQKPLVRFRSAMLLAAGKISAAPWDKGFAREAETLILRDVEPSILELEQCVQDARIHKHLLKPFAEGEWKLTAAGTIAVGVTHAVGAPGLLTGILGATLPVVPLVNSVISSWRSAVDQVERHPFYFYYQLRGDKLTRDGGFQRK
jgi:hypothetical protein